LTQFPFVIHGFHSDNGSEFINQTVAKLLNKLMIQQTKSRPRHSNDNGLAETKNGARVLHSLVLLRKLASMDSWALLATPQKKVSFSGSGSMLSCRFAGFGKS
jgi:transposase InsO family protein